MWLALLTIETKNTGPQPESAPHVLGISRLKKLAREKRTHRTVRCTVLIAVPEAGSCGSFD